MHFGRQHAVTPSREVSIYFQASAPLSIDGIPSRFGFDPFLDDALTEPLGVASLDIGPCRLFHLELHVEEGHRNALAGATFGPLAEVYLIREPHHRHQADRVRVVGVDADPDETSGVLLAGYLDDDLAAKISTAMTEVGVLPGVVISSIGGGRGGTLRVLGSVVGSVKLETSGLDLASVGVA